MEVTTIGERMNTLAMIVGYLVIGVTVFFSGWMGISWVFNRWDERKQRREKDERESEVSDV